MKKGTKTLILCITTFVVAAVLGFGLWFLLRDKAPVGNGNVIDVAWYNENGTEFTITTADELFEVAELSKYYDFKDQTIKLGADIVVNEGDASDWEFVMPDRRWEPITGFAGTFDGQGHTISGLYGLGHFYGSGERETVFYTTGLFADTQEECVIKNFKLVNSYFSSDLNEGVGSISSFGGGTFDSIYSDALIISYKSNNGGIVGLLDKEATITNCWFDGEIRVEGTVGRFTGGIVGRVMSSGGQSKIEHCLNTANISSTVTNRGMNTGGIIGNVQSQARVNVEDCLTVGDIIVDYTSAVGSFIGNIESSAGVIIKNAYVKAESFDTVMANVNGTLTGSPIAHNEVTLTGYDAYKWTALDFENYWAIVEDGTPILQSFAEAIPSVEGLTKGFDTSWYDMAQSSYVISTAEQLYGLAVLSYSTDFTGKLITLANDIVLNEGNAEDWAKMPPEDRWIPISTYGYPFEGMFDGQGHTISGLYLNTCGNFGLFGETGTSSMIMNLKLENSYLESYGATIGSIVGRGAGTMQYVYSNAIVLGYKGNVGGLVGQVSQKKGMQLSNCWFDGVATNLGNKSDTKKIGGLIGAVRSSCSVIDCLNTGTVDASTFNYNQSQTSTPVVVPIVGGLIGYVEKDMSLTIQNCLNAGNVLYNEAATAAYGSVIGYIDGEVTAFNVYAVEESCSNHPLKQSKSGQVCPIEQADLTGYKAYQWTLLDFERTWAVVKDGTPILKYFASETPSLDGVKKEVDVSWYSTDKNTYVLDSREDLYGFRLMSYNTDFADKTVKLGKNITLNTGDASKWAKSAPKYKWTPIGSEKYSFKGTFDGGMHSISGIYVKADKEFSGFFAVLTEEAAVKNLKIMNSYYESSADFIGTIVGAGNADLSNVYSNAILVTSANTASGFVGRITKDVKITNCWFDGSVTVTGKEMPNRRGAGIVGYIYSGKVTLSHCLNTGTISAPNYVGTNSATSKAVVPMIGGLVGYVGSNAELKIDDSLNTGLVTCNPAATTGFSAIVGYSDGVTTVTDTFATVESCVAQARGKITGNVSTYKEKDITGYAGYQWMNLDFDKYWTVVVSPTADTPVLKSFVGNVPSLAGVEKLFDISWYDEKKTEYVLKDKADLNGFAYLSNSTDFAGKTIKLGADIVMNTDMGNPSYNWDPIGNKNIAFAGTFDGQKHTISGLYVNTDVENAGLFARTDKNSVIKNLILKNSYFESTAMNIGSIAGIGQGTFDTIKSEATVVGHNARVGGLVGFTSVKGTKLNNCWFAGTVTNKGNGEGLRGTGGLVAVAYGGSEMTITNCLNTGTVDASAYEYNQKTETDPQIVVLAGGLVGWVRTDAILTLGDSLNTGNVIVSSKSADSKNGYIGYGSVVGYVNGKVENSGNFYTTAESSTKQMNDCKTGLVIVNKDDIMGVKGYQWNKIDLDFVKYWTFVVDNVATTDKDETDTPILQSFASQVINVAGVEKMLDYSWLDKAKGTEADPYMIMDVDDLYGMAELSQSDSFAGKYFKLGADIEVNGGNAADWATKAPEYSWTPIGTSSNPFKGNFDGRDEETGKIYEISGLYYKTASRYGGFFAAIDSATVKNLKLTNSYFESSVTGIADFGGLAGLAKAAKFDTIYSDAIVVGAGEAVAGLVAKISGGTQITKCWFDGNVTNTKSSDMRAGGLVGTVTDKTNNAVKNCLNTGLVNASKATGETIRVGGLVGHVASSGSLTMENCLNTGEVKYNTATALYGSVIGASSAGATVKNVYATTESCNKQIEGSVNGSATAYAKSDISGELGYQWARLTLDFKEIWTLVKDSTPVLQAFADQAGDVIDVTTVVQRIDFSWQTKAQGTETDPYMIMDIGDLYGMAQLSQSDSFAGKYFKLGADITVNTGNAADWKAKAPEYSWSSIGTSANPFKGNFDGRDGKTGQIYEISGIYHKTASRYGGFFAAIDSATVKNLKLTNSYFESSQTGQADFAGLVGYAKKSTLDTIYSDAIVVGAGQRVAGLVAQFCGGSTMTKCWFDGSMTNTKETDMRSGGLVGSVTDKAGNVITNSLNTGLVNASKAKEASIRVAGLVGHVASSGSLTMSNALNTGTVKYNTATGMYGSVGGDVGTRITATNVYTTSDSCSVKGLTAAVSMGIGAMRGDNAKTKLTGFDFENVWSTVPESTAVLKAFASIVYDTSWYDAAKSEYVLNDKGDLYGFAVLSRDASYNGFAEKTIKLGSDIIVNQGDANIWASAAPSHIWVTIGTTASPFKGTFDGCGRTISGLYISTGNAGGLFGVTDVSAKVKNVKIVNSYFNSTASSSGVAYIGSVAGVGKGTFHSIYSSSIVAAKGQRVGGLIGNAQENGFKMTNCWFDGSVTSGKTDDVRIGGLIGSASDGTGFVIDSCLNTGSVNASGATSATVRIGGLVGHVQSTKALEIKNSLNIGKVTYNTATGLYGSLVGAPSSGTVITNCFATSESCAELGTTSGTKVSEADIKGESAKVSLKTLLENSEYWMVGADNEFPLLKGFKNK